MTVEEGRQARATGLLLAFEQDRHVNRQAAMHRMPGAARFEEGHHLSLIVGGAARDDDLAIFWVLGKARREGRRRPLLKRIRRLHVVMAIEQHT